jgi:hypothetical protein
MHPRRIVLPILASGLILVTFAGCQATAPPDAGPSCQGFLYIDWQIPEDTTELPTSTYGELRCNGQCPDGSRCTVQSEEFETPQRGIVKREWCACPAEQEPDHCHGVRELYVSGERRIWRFNCHGDCPAEGDFCREQHREVEAPDGVDKRMLAQCECIKPK